MLELKGISKDFGTGTAKLTALEDVNVTFRTKEFVAIQGRSGAGKTTLLNLIAGLTVPTSGNVIFRGKNTTEFTDKEWDAYRNNSIGVIFQNYSLLNHLTILENVMLKLEISGMEYKERKEKAVGLLTQMGLGAKLNRKPDQLSGGEQQRVVIARAIANDPDILLCDEPTGYLDEETGIEILNLIQKEARSRLVIMVTHDSSMADLYADRLIRIENGTIASDTKPYKMRRVMNPLRLKKNDIGVLPALSVALRGFRKSGWRSVITTLGYSIGILCICLALNLSIGFHDAVLRFEEQIMGDYPIEVTSVGTMIRNDSIKCVEEVREEDEEKQDASEDADVSGLITATDASKDYISHENLITEEYLEYTSRIDADTCGGIGYVQPVTLNLLRIGADGQPVKATVGPVQKESETGTGVALAAIPKPPGGSELDFLRENYDCVAGTFPEGPSQLALVVDKENKTDAAALAGLGFEPAEEGASIQVSPESLVGMKLLLLYNDVYYSKAKSGNYEMRTDYDKLVEGDNPTLELTGIIRVKEDGIEALRRGVVYSSDLVDQVVEHERSSAVVRAQRSSSKNVLTGETLDEKGKAEMMSTLGGDLLPYAILFYPRDFASKDAILTYLDEYNTEEMAPQDQVFAQDLAREVTGGTGAILKGVSSGLLIVTFLAVLNCLVLMVLMTSDAVRTRKREIGILRALGIHKSSVRNIFMLRAGLVGLFTGVFGVIFARIIADPINDAITRLTGLTGIMPFAWWQAALLVLFSVALTVLAAFFPSRAAADRDAAELLMIE